MNLPPIVQEIRDKNLKHFKKNHPALYEIATETEMTNTQLVIANGEVDLIYHGKSIYDGKGIAYARSEVEEFKSIYPPDKLIRTINTPVSGLYAVPRFFQKRINEFISEQTKGITGTQILYHPIGETFHFLVVMGTGLGLHINELLDTCNIQNLVLFETDKELFIASTFVTDWEELSDKLSRNSGKSLKIVVAQTKLIENEYVALWNEIIRNCPQFPYNTIFYNHGRHDKYGDYIRKLNEDQRMFMSLWGFYDDEINQVNHIFHNINNNISWIPNRQDFKIESPVIVVGNGPSLDDRIEQIKQLKPSSLLISAGSSLLPLLEYGITPDIHIEIESDYTVTKVLKSYAEKHDLSGISFVTGVQSSPEVFKFFKQSSVFVKDSQSIRKLLDSDENVIYGTTPTCTNAAVAFATHYFAPQVYLFGMDFGFYDTKVHHSKMADYYHEDGLEETQGFEELVNENHFEKEGYHGTCKSTNFYFTAKRRIEMDLKRHKSGNKLDVVCCSDGLKIEGSRWVPKDHVFVPPKEYDHQETLNKYISCVRNDRQLNLEEITNYINEFMNEIYKLLKFTTANTKEDLDSLSTSLFMANEYVDSNIQANYGPMFYFIRGTIWHIFYSVYAITCSAEKTRHATIIEAWKEFVNQLIEEWPSHIDSVLKRDMSETDERIHKTIMEELETPGME